MFCSIVIVWTIYQLFRAKESPSAATANTQLCSAPHYTTRYTTHCTTLHILPHCTELKGRGSDIKPISLQCSLTQRPHFSVQCAEVQCAMCHPIHLRNNKHFPSCLLSTQLQVEHFWGNLWTCLDNCHNLTLYFTTWTDFKKRMSSCELAIKTLYFANIFLCHGSQSGKLRRIWSNREVLLNLISCCERWQDKPTPLGPALNTADRLLKHQKPRKELSYRMGTGQGFGANKRHHRCM